MELLPWIKMRFLVLHILIAFCTHSPSLFGQPETSGDSTEGARDPFHVLKLEKVGNDTLPSVELSPVYINDWDPETGRAYRRKYRKLRKKVVKVYPYAKVAGLLLQQYNRHLDSLNNEIRRKFYMKKTEKDLKREFKDDIKNLSLSEGLILIKLIDRETGNTSFQVIKEMRGGFSAFMWQALAKVFGADLKRSYAPDGEDRIIEKIVQRIEAGNIRIPERTIQTEKVRNVLSRAGGKQKWWKEGNDKGS